MDENELKEIREQAERATPRFVVDGQELPDGAIAWNWELPADGDLYIGYATGPDATGATFKEIRDKVHTGDGPFYRRARRDVLALVAEVERLQEENERLREVLKTYADEKNWTHATNSRFDWDELLPAWDGGEDNPWIFAQDALTGKNETEP